MIGVCKVVEYYTAMFVFILIFIVAFHLSHGSISWLYIAEVTVDQASGVVISGQFINLLWLTLTMEYMIKSGLEVQGTFWLFAVFMIIGTIFVSVFVKETRGLTDLQKKGVYFFKSISEVKPM